MSSDIEKVINEGFCIGCGVCAGISDSIEISLNNIGIYQANVKEADFSTLELAGKICPFSKKSLNEDQISDIFYSRQNGIKHTKETGFYFSSFVGYVNTDEYRINSTSGGILSGIAKYFLENGIVDGVATVLPKEDNCGYEYKICTDPNELLKSRKSKYYPIEASNIVKEIKKFNGKIIFIGLPCTIKALNNARLLSKEIDDRILYTFGLFCGHLKTKNYVDFLIRNIGFDKNKKISSFDFRKKNMNNPANSYSFSVITKEDGESEIPMKQIWGGSWSYNFFMPKACEFCDDIMSETADIAVGDAWLPKYLSDSKGTSILVVRNKEIHTELTEIKNKNLINLETIMIQDVIKSQMGGIRQRKEALEYRKISYTLKRKWYPKKRTFKKILFFSPFLIFLQEIRMKTREKSHTAFIESEKYNDFSIFKDRLYFLVKLHDLINLIRHIPKKITSTLKKAIGIQI